MLRYIKRPVDRNKNVKMRFLIIFLSKNRLIRKTMCIIEYCPIYLINIAHTAKSMMQDERSVFPVYNVVKIAMNVYIFIDCATFRSNENY